MQKGRIGKQKNQIKKRRRYYRNFLLQNNLKTKDYLTNVPFYQKNVIIKNLVDLLSLEKLNSTNFLEHFNLLQLLTTELYFFRAQGLNKSHANQLQNVIQNCQKLSIPLLNINLEKLILTNFQFTELEIQKYFNYHRFYAFLASIFAAPFQDKKHYLEYYHYAYYLVMFLKLSGDVNSKIIQDRPEVFYAKLKTQQSMIVALQQVTPEFFNRLIIQTNKWLKQTNSKKIESEKRF